MDSLPTILSRLLLASVLFCSLAPAHAGLKVEPVIVLAQLGSFPPEQRRQMREQMREHWQQIPEEERQAHHERFREAHREPRESHQLLAPEERRRMRHELRWRERRND